MTVVAQTPAVAYTGNGAQTVFAFAWRQDDASWMRVTLDGISAVAEVDYVVEGATVRFMTPPAAGVSIALQRRSPDVQAKALPNINSITPFSLETAYDRATMGLQELREVTDRGVTAPVGEAGISLPPVAARANRFAAFDYLGRIIGAVILASAQVASVFGANLMTAPSAAEAADLLPSLTSSVPTAVHLRLALRVHGRQIWMKGYNAIGDGGGGLFTYDATSIATPDDGIVIQPTAVITPAPGRWIRDLSYAGSVHLAWFGADNTGATNTTAHWLNWIAACQRLQMVGYAGPGRFDLDQHFLSLNAVRTTGMTLVGSGKALTILDFRGQATPNLMFYCDSEPYRDNFYLKICQMSIWGDGAGPVVQLGQDDFSDPMNMPVFEDVNIQNFNQTDACETLRVNYVTAIHYRGQINGGTGGFVGGKGRALVLRQGVFGFWQLSFGTAEWACVMQDGFNYGNVFAVPDIENVKGCFWIKTAFAVNNMTQAGQFGYSRKAIQCDAGSSFIIDNPNFAPSGTLVTAAVTTNGSPIITGLASVEGVELGRGVTGPGIPVGATVLAVDSVTNQVTISANATATSPPSPPDPPTLLTFAGATTSDFVGNYVGLTVRSHGALPVTTPAVAATGVMQTNTQGTDIEMTWWGGTVTGVKVGADTYGLTSGTITIRSGQTWGLNYTVAPTTKWRAS